jgi:hypothetical protein
MSGELNVEELLGMYAMQKRREAVASLMAGNDTQCFTTEQYVDRYIEQDGRLEAEFRAGHRRLIRELASMHLRSVGAREVKPDLWTTDNQENHQ